MTLAIILSSILIIIGIIASIASKVGKETKESFYNYKNTNYPSYTNEVYFCNNCGKANMIAIDTSAKSILVLSDIDNKFNSKIIPFSHITSSEIIVNNGTAKTGTIGRGLVGGLLFGVAGAVVGSLSANTINTLTLLKVHVRLKNEPTLTMDITLHNGGVIEGEAAINSLLESAAAVNDIFQYAVNV